MGRIKHKTTYRVYFDNEKLLFDCARALREAPLLAKRDWLFEKPILKSAKAALPQPKTSSAGPVTSDETDIELPDLLTDLQDPTQQTRRSIAHILTHSGRLDDFKRNPQ